MALLVIPAPLPAQAAAAVETLAQCMPHHTLRGNALGWAFIVRAAGGMNVMVAGIPALSRRVDPALQLERLRVRGGGGHGDRALQRLVFRPACIGDGVLARLQSDRLAVVPVDLGVEAEIRRQPP